MTHSDAQGLDPTEIVEVAVYPPLGIARVGNAKGDLDFVMASEVVGGTAQGAAAMRDADGAIKRQAVRFRIYARLSTGAVRELTMDDGVEIQWQVGLANLKAGWYEFTNALDLPGGLAIAAPRRNAQTTDRARLDLTPPAKSIQGRSSQGPQYVFEGRFFTTPVYLGELRTDPKGRLILLGGRGWGAPLVDGTKPTTFANNELWFDDVADGPVRAVVTVAGKTFEAKPGYVAVAPPNFAPGLFGVVTMDDVVRDLFIGQGWISQPTETRFTRDIWPIFSRLTAMQWVNHGLFMAHGSLTPREREIGV